MWILRTREDRAIRIAYFKGYDHIRGKVVLSDTRSFAKAFPSRTAAEETMHFYKLHDYEVTTIWG